MFKLLLSVYAALGDQEGARRTLGEMNDRRFKFDVEVCLQMADLFVQAKVRYRTCKCVISSVGGKSSFKPNALQ
jgi:hypothetical protein